MTTYTVYGLITSSLFAKCNEAAEYVNKFYSNEDDNLHVIVNNEVVRDYIDRRTNLITTKNTNDNNSNRTITNEVEVYVVKHFNGVDTVMTGDAFLTEMMQLTNFRLVKTNTQEGSVVDKYALDAAELYRQFLRLRGNSYCWMRIKIGDEVVGEVTFELFSRKLPRTCNNFRRLCKGYKMQSANGLLEKVLTYKNSTFFRIMKEAWVMGGSLQCHLDGDNDDSNNCNDCSSGTQNIVRCCYGYSFPDEGYVISHDAPGILGMCNDGAHTNGSAFYITRNKMKWMDKTYVAFGRVIDGMHIIDAIHNVPCLHNQAPKETIRIVDCGVIDVSSEN